MHLKRWIRRNPAGTGLIAVLCVGLVLVLALLGAEQSKRESHKLLQSDTLRGLDDLWETSNQKFETIRSEKLAALREERPANGQRGANDRILTFAVYTHQKPTVMLSNMMPILDKLERSMTRSLKRPAWIDLRIYRGYDDAQDALVRGEVDFMRLGSASYIKAKERDRSISLLLAENGRVRGCIFVRADADISSLNALKGKKIAFVDPNSTTGNYLAKLQLLRAGLTAKDLPGGGTNFSRSHDTVVKAVSEHQSDAGAANANVVEKFTSKDGTRFRVLKEYLEPMGLPWAARPRLAPAVAEAIRTGLRSVRDQAVLDPLGSKTTGFIDARDEDYDKLREAMNEAKKFDGEIPDGKNP